MRLRPGDAALHGDTPVRVLSLRSYEHLDIRGQLRTMAGALVLPREQPAPYWVKPDQLVPLAPELPTFTSVEEADAWLETEARIHDELAPELPARLGEHETVTCDSCGCCTWVLDVGASGQGFPGSKLPGAKQTAVNYMHMPMEFTCMCFARQCGCTRKAVPPS